MSGEVDVVTDAAFASRIQQAYEGGTLGNPRVSTDQDNNPSVRLRASKPEKVISITGDHYPVVRPRMRENGFVERVNWQNLTQGNHLVTKRL